MESNELYDQLLNNEGSEELEKTLVRLIHASFTDEHINISHEKPSTVYFDKDWIEPGAFAVEEYTIEKINSDEFRVRLISSYDEMAVDDEDEADFHAPLEVAIVYQLILQCGRDVHSGDGKIMLVPKV